MTDFLDIWAKTCLGILFLVAPYASWDNKIKLFSALWAGIPRLMSKQEKQGADMLRDVQCGCLLWRHAACGSR